MFNYGVGGQEVKQDASEAIADIPLNRTMFVQKLTDTEPTRPQAIYDLKTVDEVFEFFKPSVKADLEKADGSTATEEFRFGNVGDFSAKSLTSKSPFMSDLNLQQEQYYKMLKRYEILQKIIYLKLKQTQYSLY